MPPTEKTTKGKDSVKQAPTSETGEQPTVSPTVEEGKPPKHEEVKPEAKPSEKKVPQPRQQKWWDPFGLLKDKK